MTRSGAHREIDRALLTFNLAPALVGIAFDPGGGVVLASNDTVWKLDVDHDASEAFRVIQCTPPGSACSIAFGRGITDAEPGSIKGLHLVVTDIEAARAELAGRGVEVSDIRYMNEGTWTPGVDPEHRDYNSFADFADPDGNTWVLQEVGHRAT